MFAWIKQWSMTLLCVVNEPEKMKFLADDWVMDPISWPLMAWEPSSVFPGVVCARLVMRRSCSE
jgi:hypothetical protein